MDERQQNIEVGAGLQESRINQELLDWLNKWGSWILTGVLIIVLAYLGYVKYGEYQADRRDKAFDAYMETRGSVGTAGVLSGSPDNLLTIADEKAGIGAVSHLARIDAADIFLGWARLGLATGTANPAEPAATDILTPEAEADLFTRAYELFKRVSTDTNSNTDQALINLKAKWGMAASSASLGEFDRAMAEYEAAKSAAEKLGMFDVAAHADTALASIEGWKNPIAVYAEDEIPIEMRPIDPTAPSSVRPALDDAFLQNSTPVRIGPDGTLFETEAEVLPAEPEEDAGKPVSSEDPSGQ